MRTLAPLFALFACKGGQPTPEPTSSDCIVGFADRDGDGYGNPQLRASSCQEAVVENDEDCNDQFSNAHPGAEEICDGVDNDCDGLTDAEDEGVDVPIQYVDNDDDGFGGGAPVYACELLADHVEVGGDCNDLDDLVNPAAPEVCDGVDNNCDGDIDDDDLDDFDFLHAPQWFIDGDGDGFGGPVVSAACTQPPGTTGSYDDCNDIDALSFPGALERCNGIDDDCDGLDDTANACGFYDGVFSGPFTLTMEDTVTYTCTGTLDLTIDMFAVPPIQGTYACTFDGQEGWDLQQTGTIDGEHDVEGIAAGVLDALGTETYDWTGNTNVPQSGSAVGLWIDGLVSWEVNASWTLDPAP